MGRPVFDMHQNGATIGMLILTDVVSHILVSACL
jgi:hypothetical protein